MSFSTNHYRRRWLDTLLPLSWSEPPERSQEEERVFQHRGKKFPRISVCVSLIFRGELSCFGEFGAGPRLFSAYVRKAAEESRKQTPGNPCLIPFRLEETDQPRRETNSPNTAKIDMIMRMPTESKN